VSDRKLADAATLGEVEEYGVVRFHLRGREIVVREMPAEDYEQALRAAAAAADDGKTDMLVLEKLIALGSTTVDGKEIDPEDWSGKGKDKFFTYPVTQRIADEAKKLHWLTLETDEEMGARKVAESAAAKEAAKAKGNDLPNS
jgi:hypothetical protein